MRDFDWEVLERKRLANQAKYRKRGSKSKKCPLPSDGMTHKQWKERNGEVMEYNLNKPMTWKVFRKMPKDLQEQYLKKLRDEHEATAKAIANMFGIEPTSFWAWRKRNDMLALFPRNGGMEPGEDWDRFIKGEAAPGPEPEVTPPQPADGATLPEGIEAIENTTVDSFEAQEAAEPPRKAGMLLDSFTLQSSGSFDPDAIRNSLAMILQKGQQVRIEINCTVEG